MKHFKNQDNHDIEKSSNLEKINKEDFDAYLGKEPFYQASDKEIFMQSLNKKRPRKTPYLLVTVTAAILSAFIIVVQMMSGSTSPVSQDDLNFEVTHRPGGDSITINHEDHELYMLGGKLNGETFHETNENIGDGSESFELPIDLASKSETLKLELEEASIIIDEALTFEIDSSSIEYQETRQMNQLIGEINETAFYIDSMDFSRDGLEVTLRAESKSDHMAYDLVLPLNMPFQGEYNQAMNQLKLTDESGNELDYRNLVTFSEEDGGFGFTIPANQGEITASISNLLYNIPIDEEFELQLE